MGKRGYFVAVGDDGMRPVVWGIGTSEAAALRDAVNWTPEALVVHRTTRRVFERVKAGDPSWTDAEIVTL